MQRDERTARAAGHRAPHTPNTAAPLGERSAGREARLRRAPSKQIGRIGSCHVPPCDNAQQHVQLMELASAITADLAVDEDGALLHRAASHHCHVARLLVDRADRAERLDHQLHAMRPRAGRRVRGAARVGRSGSGPREWTLADPSELTAPPSPTGASASTSAARPASSPARPASARGWLPGAFPATRKAPGRLPPAFPAPGRPSPPGPGSAAGKKPGRPTRKLT